MGNELASKIVATGSYINNWDDRTSWVRLPDNSEVPAYLSCRRLVSIPQIKTLIKSELATLSREVFSGRISSVVGLATAGIVWGDAISDELVLPFGYVRGEKKAYGVGKLVECNPPSDSDALLVDDVLLTGTSFLVAKEALMNEKNIRTAGAITIASLYPKTLENFEDILQAPVVSLIGYEDLCTAAVNSGLFNESQHDQMMSYYTNPIGFQFKES